MSLKAREAYLEWQSANAEARQAEDALAAAWESFDLTRQVPSDEMIKDVYRLRFTANDKLTEALIAIRGASKERRPGADKP